MKLHNLTRAIRSFIATEHGFSTCAVIRSFLATAIIGTIALFGATNALAGNWADHQESWTVGTPITTPGQLARFAAMVNSGNTFKDQEITLGQNLNMSAYNWEPIWRLFNGTFDGKGYTISDIVVNTTGLYAAFFYEIGDGVFL